jgi:hypothetical protein
MRAPPPPPPDDGDDASTLPQRPKELPPVGVPVTAIAPVATPSRSPVRYLRYALIAAAGVLLGASVVAIWALVRDEERPAVTASVDEQAPIAPRAAPEPPPAPVETAPPAIEAPSAEAVEEPPPAASRRRRIRRRR